MTCETRKDCRIRAPLPMTNETKRDCQMLQVVASSSQAKWRQCSTVKGPMLIIALTLFRWVKTCPLVLLSKSAIKFKWWLKCFKKRSKSWIRVSKFNTVSTQARVKMECAVSVQVQRMRNSRAEEAFKCRLKASTSIPTTVDESTKDECLVDLTAVITPTINCLKCSSICNTCRAISKAPLNLASFQNLIQPACNRVSILRTCSRLIYALVATLLQVEDLTVAMQTKDPFI